MLICDWSSICTSFTFSVDDIRLETSNNKARWNSILKTLLYPLVRAW